LITLGGPITLDALHAPGQGADGEMDDFAWFRRVLDATEIGALMAEHDFRDRDDTLCGNRQLDTRGHTCDDGNSISGDGCDRHCMLELDVDCGKARFPCIEKAKPKRKSWKDKRKGGG
jgi:cysteine-rich repeat protein